jgi:hypothetical protein
MALSQEQKDILDIVSQEAGFSGVRGEKALVSGEKVTRSKLLKTLGLRECLITKGTNEALSLALHWDTVKLEVESYLFSQKVVVEPQDAQSLSPVINESATLKYYQVAADQFFIVKTLDVEGIETYSGHVKPGQLPVIIINKESRTLVPGRKKSIDGILHLLGTSREDVLKNNNVPLVSLRFDPYRTELVYTGDDDVFGQGFPILNTCPIPKWRYLKAKPHYGGFIKALLENVFVEEKERHHAILWLRQMLIGRNDTILIELGPRAVGKTLVAKLAGALVGNNHVEIVGQETINGKFNGQIYQKRLAFFDEVGISDETTTPLEKLKAFTNDMVKIEQKGVEAFSADNYCNYILSANPSSEMKIGPQERRFFIPRIGRIDFKDVYSPSEINIRSSGWVKQEIPEDCIHELAEFGEYLLAMDAEGWVNSRPLKGDYFYEVTEGSMPEWQKALKQAIIEKGQVGKPLALKDIDKYMTSGNSHNNKKYIPREAKLRNFLNDHIEREKYRLGEIDPDWQTSKNKRLAILPDPRFLEAYGLHPDKMSATQEVEKFERINSNVEAMEAAKAAPEDLL